jgi:hypothetical protein
MAPIGTTPVSALAAADVDRNGTMDLMTAAPGSLVLWTNDNARFTEQGDAIGDDARAALPTAIAFGDIEGDGNPDLVVGQTGAPLLAWFGSTGGTFELSETTLPAASFDVRALDFTDADDDFVPDLAVSVTGAPMHLLIARGNRLEDQPVRLPQPAPVANAVALGSWDGGCTTDAVIASDGASVVTSGDDRGVLTIDNAATVPAATDVVMVDVDDDGDLDAVLATADGVVWLAR